MTAYPVGPRRLLALMLAALLLCPAARGEGITISFVGDCSIGDAYQYRDAASGLHSAIAANGPAWPFSLVAGYLLEDDLSVANLEAVFTERKERRDKRYNLIAAPGHVQALLLGGIDAVNTANNHSLDFFEKGYADSMAVLDAAGITRFGSLSFAKDGAADDVAVVEVKGVRIGLAGATYPSQGDLPHLIGRINRLRHEEGCKLVIVSLHWGRETHHIPQRWQAQYARDLIDAGADVIFGHHPHVLQPIEFYKGKPVLYSTGNFIFGTMSRVEPASGIFQLSYSSGENGVQLSTLRVIPCMTQRYPDYRPREAQGEAQRMKVFSLLRREQPQPGMDNLPPSFLQSGQVYLKDGEMVP